VRSFAVDDFRREAKRRLPDFLFNYVDGGAGDESTLRSNVSDLAAITLRQRVLRDVSALDPATSLFGVKQRMPVVLAPIGIGGLLARRGETQAARAAEAAGINFCLSTMSICGMDEVRAVHPAPFWFQLYVMRDRAFMRDLIARAADLGCSALVFTVDMAVPGIRYRDFRSSLTNAPGLGGSLRRFGQAVARPGWAWDVGLHGRPHGFGNMTSVLAGKNSLSDYFAWLRKNFDASIQWSDLEEIRRIWKGPLLLKGILDPDDARRAADLGADGVIVSNHGGRQLDGASSTTLTLPAIADAVGDRLTVMADGGIRSGTDVLRMMALGAKGVMIGRAWAYALAADGQRGVSRVLETIETEMRVGMALTGITKVDEIDRTLIA
jgi:L-lactate dehydrogenase (cytochrome)